MTEPDRTAPIRALNLLASLPYPPRSGGHLRAWNLCSRLSAHLHQTVVCRTQQPLLMEQLAAFSRSGIVLHAVHVPPRPPLRRMLKALTLLASPYPVMMGGWDHRPVRQQLGRLLAEERFELVVVDGTPLCIYLPLLARTRALKVFHLYDIESEYLARKASVLPPGPSRLMAAHDAARMRGVERRMASMADMILVTSTRERDALRRAGVACAIEVVPNGVDCAKVLPLPAAAGSREVLYVGSMQYHPNADAVLHFAATAWPLVRARVPDAVLRVVGRAPPPSVQRLDGSQGIVVEGEVPAVEPYYRNAGALVVPLRIGGGTRLKILEALAHARPVISTTLGCEGLDLTPDRHVLVADDPAAQADAVCRVLRQPELADRLGRDGRALVEARYDWDPIAAGLYRAYAACLERRRSSFTERNTAHAA